MARVIADVMPHNQRWRRDRQLQLIVVVWTFVLVDALRQGLTLPSSDLAAFWSGAPGDSLLLGFALLSPPVLVILNHFVPSRGLWMDWPKRIVDRWFGKGTAETFWHRLRPLWLVSMGTFVLGTSGYAASQGTDAPNGGLAISSIFVAFGAGFFVAAVLDRHVLRRANAA